MAINEAKYLMSSTGPIGMLDKQITNLYDAMDAVDADKSLTYNEKLLQKRVLKEQIVSLHEQGDKVMNEYREKYC